MYHVPCTLYLVSCTLYPVLAVTYAHTCRLSRRRQLSECPIIRIKLDE